MTIPHVITIDGPAGVGKSTLGALLAQRLGYLYFDTGVMYRAVTHAVLDKSLDPAAGEAVAALAQQLDIRVEPPTVYDGRQYTVLVDGQDVTWALRRPAVEQHVSRVARHPQVRSILRARQREIALGGRVVMVGRDIGSIVMPDAELKIYLQASPEERARRRTAELHARGCATTLDDVLAELRRRDALDQHVMMPAADALIVDVDALSPEQEVEFVLEHLTHHS